MLFALGFIVTFVNGGLTGLFLGNVVVDVPLSDTMFVVAHFHMVMGVAPIMVIFGAIYHWYPKVTGRMLNETLGQFHFWVTFLGAYAIFFPMHYLGLLGVPRRYYELGETGFIPPSAHDSERLHHHRGADRRCRPDRLPVQSDLEPVQRRGGGRQSMAGNDAGMADAARRRRRMAIGARNCRSSIAGPMTTACPARPRISFRRTSRRSREPVEGAAHERHPDLPGRDWRPSSSGGCRSSG